MGAILATMRLSFAKMHGAGNDFIVLDETRSRLGLTAAAYRFLADRRFGVGADQILTVRPAPEPGVDFAYHIHNADGGEVEQCGNGARCFARYVRDAGLTDKNVLRVWTRAGVIEPTLVADGRVRVDMGPPMFALGQVPFDVDGVRARPCGTWEQWPLAWGAAQKSARERASEPAWKSAWESVSEPAWVCVLSMGNPHAVLRVDDVETAPVALWGPLIENHPRFPRRVNAGFLQVIDRSHVRLRVYERGAGETLACGTGACAAVVAGVRAGWLDAEVDVAMRGGALTVRWDGADTPVWLTGPAVFVFRGEIDISDDLLTAP